MQSRRYFLACWLVWAGAASAGFAASGAKSEEPKNAYEHRALLLYLISQYTEWPAEALPPEGKPFILGILGPDPFKSDLDIVRRKSLKQRRIQVKTSVDFDQLSSCNMLYINESESSRLPEILARLGNAPVLTFAEIPGFLEAGGIVRLWVERKGGEDYLRFHISKENAEKRRLRINSQVLRLSRPEPEHPD